MIRCVTLPLVLSIVLCALGPLSIHAAEDGPWKAGVGRAKILPEHMMWLSGYSSRTKPAEGAIGELWCKALALEDSAGKKIVAVTLDLIGIDRDMSLAIRGRIEKQHGLKPEQIALFCSHTHSGPVVGRNLTSMYFLDDEQTSLVHRYTDWVSDKIVETVDAAVKDLKPAKISWTSGITEFAVNRRNNKEAQVPELIAAGQLKGPVDHQVPVLAVHDEEGRLKGVLFGYACHSTVLNFQQFNADYPGYAQALIEKYHPGCTAMFFAGCGGDQNPLPRRTIELAEKYGRMLGDAVSVALKGRLTPVTGSLKTDYQELELPFERVVTKEQMELAAKSQDKFEARRAQLVLAEIAAGRPPQAAYPYPIQTWRLGPKLQLTALGGEVTVEYALKIKQLANNGDDAWVAAYANDVMAYIPSRTVWGEWGYEGGGAMLFYGLPSRWAANVEEVILGGVQKQFEALK